MSEQPRATGGSQPDDVQQAKARKAADDELGERIARALRSRETAQPDAAVVAARIEARLAETPGRTRPATPDQTSTVSTLTRRGGKVVVAGVVISALAVAGAGAAAAANPYSGVASAIESAAQAVGIEWSAMPEGYSREQYEAFWGAGYTAGDVEELNGLWHTDATETKARAGQLILDGAALPIAPSDPDNG